jgi:hypothetical protein
MKIHYLALLSLSFTLVACSPKTPEEMPQGVLSDAQERTLEKAQETEAVPKKADDQRRRKLEELEGK